MNKQERKNNLMPGGIPRYIRCYDNGDKSFDRYTCVFTGRYKHKTNGEFIYVSMSANPFHPQGFGQHGASLTQIDKPAYAHIGKKISFNDLPKDCKKLIIDDYIDLWNIR